ncbi:MAG: aspartate aminotransferase family protein [Clostridia bacterium]|nr:aspartate aminotransferase family protein [Clostridia bacterium]
MIWYPYAQMKTMAPPIRVERADGVFLHTDKGILIDAVSSWWSTIHGYNHPVLNAAISDQLGKFAHVMLGGLTHDPVQQLTDKLSEWLPGDLDYCFYSDSGSVAVEVALKMALQYNVNRGCARHSVLALENAHHGNAMPVPTGERNTVLALKNAYHGDTFKAMEVGDDEDYHFAFPHKRGVVHIPTRIDALEKAFSEKGNTFYCMIVEPLLQGAGGMKMYDCSFLRRARELCDRYGVLLIFDEVATGFGRTGNRFAADLVLPDILVLGKALTGGYIGHAVTVARRKVFEAFYGDDPRIAFMHGPTFMGNALACRVALASVRLFEEENYMQKIRRIEKIEQSVLLGLRDERIKEVRVMGGCACIEVVNPSVLEGFREYAVSHGVFCRPFGNILYAMVPYVIQEEQLRTVLNVMRSWFTRG